MLVGQAIKTGLRGRQCLVDFVNTIRSGEQSIEDADEKQGRDKSLGASLDYGFRHAFKDDELPIIALLHLFHSAVDVDVLLAMGKMGVHTLPELKGESEEHLMGLLERAKDIGLLTHFNTTRFAIHPALPWFLSRLFARYFDGQEGRSTAKTALRAWVGAVGVLGEYYHRQFNEGNRNAVNYLAWEESNLLHARRLARRNQWSEQVVSCMQGLQNLYEYQGREAEWARLVEEIYLDYCTVDDEPVQDREDGYSLIMRYRISLAADRARDFAKAALLQEKVIEFDRQQAAAILILPIDTSLTAVQRNRLRTLGVSLSQLGHIRRQGGDSGCMMYYQEAIAIYRKIGDKFVEAITEFNIGHAYKDLSAIRDLAAAEVAYQRSLDLHHPSDALGRMRCLSQIGLVHHERFREALKRRESNDALLLHVRSAEKYYLDGLRLCPEDALADLATVHGKLGAIYAEIGQRDVAREHFERSAQYEDKVGNPFGAGLTRFNMALMYSETVEREDPPVLQRANLLRARAYAEAALRDFRYYQGRAANDEADAERLLGHIGEALDRLSG